MSGPDQPSRDEERIEGEAAAWLVRRDRGLSAAEQDAFLHWLTRDPRHRTWFGRHQRTWTDLNLLADWKPEHSREPNPDLMDAPLLRRGRGRRWAVAVALSAAAALVAGMWWRSSTLAVGPATTLAEVSTVEQDYERRVLEDGSVVELNRGTRLEVSFTPGERRVRLLQGEANFTVAKQPDRPFIVRADDVDVRAVGTAFHVSLDEQRVHVLVTEGRVRVADGPVDPVAVPAGGRVETLLGAGQALSLEKGRAGGAAVVALTPAEQAQRLAWRTRQLEFDSTTLGQVVTSFNRRNAVRLEVVDPELLDIPIVASFRSDNVEGFVRLLELTAGVRVERDGSILRLHRRR